MEFVLPAPNNLHGKAAGCLWADRMGRSNQARELQVHWGLGLIALAG